jgi:predicted  nucleic acid-binding Zn-ribbon protein
MEKAIMSSPSDIEKESLEAHVELCAIRYNNLETKIDNLEQRLDKLEIHMVDIKNSLSSKVDGQNKQTISIFTTILGVLVAGLIGFISNGIFK